MARLRDAGTVIRKIGFLELAKRVWTQIDEDNIFVWASSLSYSWILALFPFLIFLLTLIPYLPADRRAEAQKQIQEVIDTQPRDVRKLLDDFVQPKIKNLLEQEQKSLLTIGLLVTLWAASGGMAATTAALDRAWDIEIRRNFFARRAAAVMLTVVVSLLLMLILFLLPIGTLIINWVIGEVTFDQHRIALVLLNAVRWFLGVMVMFLVIEVVYYFGPNIKQNWRWVSPGSLFCAVVWVVLGLVFRIYVDRFGKYDQTYGTVGGVAVLLLVFYFDAFALLVGAEINSEIEYEYLGVPKGTRDFTRKGLKKAAAAAATPPTAPTA